MKKDNLTDTYKKIFHIVLNDILKSENIDININRQRCTIESDNIYDQVCKFTIGLRNGGLTTYIITLPKNIDRYSDYFKRQIIKYCVISFITQSISPKKSKKDLLDKYSCIIRSEYDNFEQYKINNTLFI